MPSYTPKEEPQEPISTILVKYIPLYKYKQYPIKTKDLLTIKCFNYNKFGYYIRYCLYPYSKKTKIALSRIKPGLVSISLEKLYSSVSESKENPENKYP